MSLNFTTNNWETIANGLRFYSLLLFFLVLAFRKPISDRFAILIHRGHQRKVERANMINIARNLVSQRNLDPNAASRADFTKENGYLAIRRHLDDQSQRYIEAEAAPGLYQRAVGDRLARLAGELDRLSKKWRLNV